MRDHYWLFQWRAALEVACHWAKIGRRCRISASDGRVGPYGQRWRVEVLTGG